MNLFIIRHGQSITNLSKEPLADGGLTDLGRSQAAMVAECMEGADLDHIISSPLMRAIETARPLAQSTGLPIRVWTDTHELWTLEPYRGLQPDKMKKLYPEIVFDEEPDPKGWYCSGQETSESGYHRAKAVLERLRATFDGERVALVAHGAFNRRLLLSALEMGHEVNFRPFGENGYLWWLAFNGSKVTINYIGKALPLFK